MNKIVKTVAGSALTLAMLGTPQAEALVFTLDPAGGAAPGHGGETVGWGYTLYNDTPDYLLFTGADLQTPTAQGTFTDWLGPRGLELAPSQTAVQAFNLVGNLGVGSFAIDPSAPFGGLAAGGRILLSYDSFSRSSSDPGFDPGTDLVAAGSTVAAEASVPVTRVAGTLTTDDLRVVGSAAVGAGLAANGIANTGALTNTGEASLTSADGSANLGVSDGGAALAVQNAVGGANGVVANAQDTTLSGGNDTGNTVLQATQDGIAITGNGSATGSLSVAGRTSTQGIANTGALTSTGDASFASTDGTAVVSIADGTASLLVNNANGGKNGISVTRAGTTISGVGPSTIDSADGTAGVAIDNGTASLGVQNAHGGTNGVTVTATSTVITGGTGTTSVNVDDSGVTITGTGPSKGNLTVQGDTSLQGRLDLNGGMRVAPNRTVDFGGNRLQGIGDGLAPTDAVNRAQLDDVQQEARRGVAIAAALDTTLPDPDRRFRVNLKAGYYNGESAIALSGAGRVSRDVALLFGIGSDTSLNETAGTVGVSYQW